MTAVALPTTGGRRLLNGYAWTVLLLILAPAFVLIPISFAKEPSLVLPPTGFSWQWYHALTSDPSWRASLALSLKIAASVAVLNAVVGSLAAVGLSRLTGRTARLLKVAFMGPLVVPVMVLAVALYFEFANLRLLGSFWSLVFAHAVFTLPLVLVTVSARLITIDPTLERAAAASGAGALQTFRLILFPLMAGAVLAGAALVFVTSFDEVVIALFLSGPRLETLPLRMWEGITVGGLDLTIAAVTTVELVVAMASFLLFELFLVARRRRPAPNVTPAADAVPPRAAVRRLRPQAADAAASIDFVSVTKRYSEQVAVDDVSLSIEPGEFLTLLGPSGSGKTTLLSMLAGFIEPSSGQILIEGRPMTNAPPHRREVGFVFQNYALFPHLTVEENVAFPLRLRGISKADRHERVADALALIRLSGFESRHISQLSGGQQQRVALARAIVFEPRVLLMDEPLGALDRNLRLEMQIEIKQLHRELHQTTIYVTHDQEEALNLSDRIAVMATGRVIQVGTPEQLYHQPNSEFVATFFGDANVFHGVADGDVFRITSGGRTELVDRRSGPGAIAVRPEDIRLVSGDDPGAILCGTVTDVVFQGRATRIVVDCDSRLVTILQPTAPTATPRPGDHVGLRWPPSESHFMPEAAA